MESKLDVEPSSKPGEGRRGRGHLELREDRDGLRYYLGGRRLDRGTEVELLLGDGTWLRGTYEWRGVPVVWPALRVELSGQVSKSSERKLSTALPIPPGALLRWPDDA